MVDRPRVLIEDWLPVVELGIESRREAAPIPGQFPKLKTLHVWWARRPLAASAGAVLGSLMPTWSDGVRAIDPERPELQSEAAYRAWFLRLCGILGDPIAAKAASARNRELGVRSVSNPYDYKPAFKNSPTADDLGLLHRLLLRTWGSLPSVADPTAGGGTIPYEAARYGLPAAANDLNPVAVAILRAGVEIPARLGPSLVSELRQWGGRLTSRIVERLEPFFPTGEGEVVTNYIFARTVACPRTGKPVPLSPNWWISTGSPKIAVKLLTHRDGRELDRCEFKIVRGNDIDFDPDQGTAAGGDAISPWDGLTIDGDYVKAEAQADRMGSQLYAVVIRTAAGRGFRPPTRTDLDAITAAETEMLRVEADWLANETIPREVVPDGVKTAEPRNFGMLHWRDMFSPRQRLVHGTFVDEFRRIVPEVRSALPTDRAQAVLALLAMLQAKAVNYDAILSSWHAARVTMRSVFDQHNYSIKLGYAEFEGARELYPWCLEQIIDAYEGIAELLHPSDGNLLGASNGLVIPGPVTVTAGNAADLSNIPEGSVTLVCIDPPYYANVMYAELADFFYVWEKHTLGIVYPELFAEELTDKKNEAVANVARFADAGRRKKELATADYRAKMTAIFAECSRILDDRGVMTVMFTHKEADAWDSLGTALMESGFTIETSWPVNTESEQSIHQAKKNAAASTIMLVCRKREPRQSSSHPFFEDLEADVRAAARDATVRFAAAGITGVDLLLSTYGPALSVISANWPVYSSEADEATGRSRLLRPEEALGAAREEVVRLRRQRLVGSAAALDAMTDFALLAWDTFKAAEFPFDEARRLALASGGLDVDELVRAKIIEKKSGTVVLQAPARRVRKRGDDLPGVKPDAVAFSVALDAVHTVMYVADVDGLPAARALLDRASLMNESRFVACLQGLVNAIPRTKSKGEWVRPEAGTLDRLCAAYFPDISLPEGAAEPNEQVEFPIDT